MLLVSHVTPDGLMVGMYQIGEDLVFSTVSDLIIYLSLQPEDGADASKRKIAVVVVISVGLLCQEETGHGP